jgi:hypothetical protein
MHVDPAICIGVPFPASPARMTCMSAHASNAAARFTVRVVNGGERIGAGAAASACYMHMRSIAGRNNSARRN